MSLIPSRIRELWQEAVRKIICSSIEDKIRRCIKNKPLNYQRIILHLEWRLGYNYFICKRYFDSIPLLEKTCSGGEEGEAKRAQGIDVVHRDCRVHRITGRCCIELYHLTRAHYHLQKAYDHYKDAIETVHILSGLTEIPSLLYEFAMIMEQFGAFESALEIYSQILSLHAMFKGYFDAMYRTAVIGKHVADISDSVANKEENLNKCLDVLQFLLEALPESINEVRAYSYCSSFSPSTTNSNYVTCHQIHIVFLYARCLECSSSPMTRYRAKAVYLHLYDACREARPPVADAEMVLSFNEWVERIETWSMLGEYFTKAEEPLLAKEAMNVYVQLIENQRKFGQNLSDILTVDQCLQIARSHASFQNYEMALRYAEYAFQKDRVNSEVRTLMTQCSAMYAHQIQKEDKMFNIITSNWRSRLWGGTYRNKLKGQVLEDNEQKLSENHCDMRARNELKYFARDKWRARFLFEEVCARRIQRMYRSRRYVWFWLSPLKASYVAKASNALAMYNRKPYNVENRREIRLITGNRMFPRKHALKHIRIVIDKQDAATNKIIRGFRAYVCRRNVFALIHKRQEQVRYAYGLAALRIQSLIRMRLAVLERRSRQRMFHFYTKSAVVIQRAWRWRNQTFQHSVTRMLHRRDVEIAWAKTVIRTVFVKRMRNFLAHGRERRDLSEAQLKVAQELRRVRKYNDMLHHAANVIKHAIRRRTFVPRMKQVSRNWWEYRRRGLLSSSARTYLGTCYPYGDDITVEEAIAYHNPGIRQNTPQFIAMLHQDTVFCSPDFSAMDCMILCSVLRHPACNVRHLVLHDVEDSASPTYEFDLVPAIGKCRSIRSVRVYKGQWTPGFITRLIEAVQVENPRVVELSIESVDTIRKFAEECAIASGKLLCDYFNYSVPGISSLSLHNCFLRDHHLTLMAQGLEVNNSIRQIVISNNLITDAGFSMIMKALMINRKNVVQRIDASGNLIMLHPHTRKMLYSYHSPSSTILEVLLLYNLITRPQPSKISRRRRVELTVKCFENDDLLPGERFQRANKPSALNSGLACGSLTASGGSGSRELLSLSSGSVRASGAAASTPVRGKHDLIKARKAAMSSTMTKSAGGSVSPARFSKTVQ